MTRAVKSIVNMEWSEDELVKLIDVYKHKEVCGKFFTPGTPSEACERSHIT